jgi:HD superfamily phosphodiesterase
MPASSTISRRQSGSQIPAAQALARRMLSRDPRRLNHVAGTARAAAFVAARVPEVPADLVIAAAWLHDIGHASHLVQSGFHALDGALFLQQGDWDSQIVRLVAHHSHSAVTAPWFGAATALAQFEPLDGLIADALTFADVIAGVDGKGAKHLLGDSRRGIRAQREVPDDVREHRYELLNSSVTAVHAALTRAGGPSASLPV